ncbi:MAG: threonylcarbamoyl-AMP synthase [Chroococcidiopsidaceae cyanobacterium CP_BM_ER_R8_30]|nr:threonylcarbamoyl-AMP synthase [Chroococcidiopsidaceae cyanobacterium CP_BM_ER_R8_30]
MATVYIVHPDTPQVRSMEQIGDALQSGAVMLYPTDTVYAIGCDLNAKSAIERVRRIKQLSNDKPLTFLCPSLSNVATYAQVSDAAYRLMKRLIPGPYTFLLPATKLVPRLVQNPKRKTTGIRVPKHPVCSALLAALGNPIISTSAHLPQTEMDAISAVEEMNCSRVELFDRLDKLVDVIVDNGEEPRTEVSTILDLTEEPTIIRRGLGWETAAAWV